MNYPALFFIREADSATFWQIDTAIFIEFSPEEITQGVGESVY